MRREFAIAGFTRERGVVLLIVLWFLALLSLLALSAAGTARTDTRLTRNLVAEATARYTAEAAISHAILRLFAEQAGIETEPVGEIKLFGSTVRLTVRDECGKIDLNTGWGGLLRGLLTLSGAADDAFPILQAMLDWRDPDHRRRVRGAEDDDYAAQGLTYGARDGLFETIEEAGQVLGMSPALYRRMAPYLTVDCLSAGIDPAWSARTVLLSIPNVAPAAVNAFMAVRDVARGEGNDPPDFRADSKYVETSPGQVHSVLAVADHIGGARVEWEAVVWLTGDAETPFLLRRWQRVRAHGPPAAQN